MQKRCTHNVNFGLRLDVHDNVRYIVMYWCCSLSVHYIKLSCTCWVHHQYITNFCSTDEIHRQCIMGTEHCIMYALCTASSTSFVHYQYITSNHVRMVYLIMYGLCTLYVHTCVSCTYNVHDVWLASDL